MANLSEDAVWVDGIYQLEDTDPLSGGTPNLAIGDGMDNVPHQQLAKRTSWLKAQVDALLGAVVAATTSVAGIVRLSSAVNSTSTTMAATPSAVKAAFDNAEGRVPNSRLVATGGLATGGGSLLADRTITVPIASQVQAEQGTDNTTAMTPARVIHAIAARGYAPNLLVNTDMAIAQRGEFSTAFGYGCGDRWGNFFFGGTSTMARAVFDYHYNFSQGGQGFSHYLRQTVSGQSAANHYQFIGQRIESVSSHAGETVTILFWARTTSGTRPIAVELEQQFGTGGSPSAPVYLQPVTCILTTGWQAFAATFNLPIVTSKVLGTAGNDCLSLNIWTSAGANFNARTNSLGVQNGTIEITGIHLRRGTATPAAVESYRRPDKVAELARCYRYCESGRVDFLASSFNGTRFGYRQRFSTPKRGVPTVFFSNQTYFAANDLQAQSPLADGFFATALCTATGAVQFGANFIVDAELY